MSNPEESTSSTGAIRKISLNGLTVTATLADIKVARMYRRSRTATSPIPPPEEYDDLPDGSCFRRIIHQPTVQRTKQEIVNLRAAGYLGSFPVTGPHHQNRTDYMTAQLQRLTKDFRISKPVLLAFSLSGIKICSPDGKCVYMAHSLRRISYATCVPLHSVFSFLAREPDAPITSQYCHSFVAKTADQAEELNNILGSAFRLVCATDHKRSRTFDELITLQVQKRNSARNAKGSEAPAIKWPKQLKAPLGLREESLDMDLRDQGSPSVRTGMRPHPNSIPGLRTVHDNGFQSYQNPAAQSNPGSPSSDESNSPTELNTYKRLMDKPPLVKRLTMELSQDAARSLRTEADDEVAFSLGQRIPTPPPCPAPRRWRLNERVTNQPRLRSTPSRKYFADTVDIPRDTKTRARSEENRRTFQSSSAHTEQDRKKRISQSSSGSSSGAPFSGDSSIPTPPPLPERNDSLSKFKSLEEEKELMTAPWFQAGIPSREITLEILKQEPVGSFMVRESTSKPGCFALSLRVPDDFQPLGIAHYLIMQSKGGYKIKGFTKEFKNLTTLITHHSIMPELLPCPLSLSRYNPAFQNTDSQDLSDGDPDYETLSDFRKMMADMNM